MWYVTYVGAVCALFQCCLCCHFFLPTCMSGLCSVGWLVSVLCLAYLSVMCGLFQWPLQPASVMCVTCFSVVCGMSSVVCVLFQYCLWHVCVFFGGVCLNVVCSLWVFQGMFDCCLWHISLLCVVCLSLVCGLFQCCVWSVSVILWLVLVMCVVCFSDFAACLSVLCGLFQWFCGTFECCVWSVSVILWPVWVLCVVCFSDLGACLSVVCGLFECCV